MRWKRHFRKGSAGFLSILLCLGIAAVAGAQEEASPAIDGTKVAIDTMWTLLCAFLVMFMALGFSMLESGLCRAKNTVNILSKNFIVYAATSLAFLVLGWGFMFGDGTSFIGTQGLWFLSGADNSPVTGDAYQGVYSAIAWTGIPLEAKFLFQLVFAATAATIISGAVAERIKFGAFFLFSLLMGAVLYPITGHWIWGGGWLAELGMWDFAGSTVVHSVGGWAALAGAIMLGPRLGKYTQDGRINPIPGHSLTSATIGVFVLWFGWFGFNPGSTMAADWSAIGHIATTTNTAAAAGVVSATCLAWVLLGKPDLTMALNGGVAGLVAITAPCAFVSVGSSVFIGLVGGILVVLSVLFFDRIRVDDPVGAISAHLTCGVWGTLSLGLFAQDKFMPDTTGNGLFFGGGLGLFEAQLIGVVAVGAFIFSASIVGWTILNGLMGIRVSAEEELEGLDINEHGNIAYPDFALATTGRSAAPAARVAPGGELLREPARPAPEPASSMRRPPAPVRQPESRRTPPSGQPAESRNSGSPVAEQAFEITIPNVDKKALQDIWHDLCEKYPHDVPQEFTDIYHDVKSFRDNTWSFRQGNPEEYRRKLQQILYLYGVEDAQLQVA